MRNAGVKILFLEQMPYNYAGAVFKALDLEGFHPVVVLGGSTYSDQLVASAGGAPAIDGSYFEQNDALYLGEDAASLPAVAHLPDLGAASVAGVRPRPLHAVRLAVDRALHPGAAGCRPRPDPGLGAPGLAQHHVLLGRVPDRDGQSGQEDPFQLLHHRPGRRRPDPAPGRPADRRAHPRVPLRRAVLLPERSS